MISPPPTSVRRPVGQQRFQLCPLFLSQVMTIAHRNDLPNPTKKIHGTRLKALKISSGSIPYAARTAHAPGNWPSALCVLSG
jgi:hypothetical protein